MCCCGRPPQVSAWHKAHSSRLHLPSTSLSCGPRFAAARSALMKRRAAHVRASRRCSCRGSDSSPINLHILRSALCGGAGGLDEVAHRARARRSLLQLPRLFATCRSRAAIVTLGWRCRWCGTLCTSRAAAVLVVGGRGGAVSHTAFAHRCRLLLSAVHAQYLPCALPAQVACRTQRRARAWTGLSVTTPAAEAAKRQGRAHSVLALHS